MKNIFSMPNHFISEENISIFDAHEKWKRRNKLSKKPPP